MHFLINGQSREFALPEDCRLEGLIDALGLKSDRIAVEYNGTIIARADWPNTPLTSGDRLEIVHFVGGGSCADGGTGFRRQDWPSRHTRFARL
jgi:thiamine biosynthesis protein ThiS